MRCCRRRRVACRFDGEGGFRFVILKDINNIGVFIVDQPDSLTCNSTLCCHQRDKAMAEEEEEILKGGSRLKLRNYANRVPDNGTRACFSSA